MDPCCVCVEKFSSDPSHPNSIVFTQCGHIVCTACFDKISHTETPHCATCRAPLAKAATPCYPLLALIDETTKPSSSPSFAPIRAESSSVNLHCDTPHYEPLSGDPCDACFEAILPYCDTTADDGFVAAFHRHRELLCRNCAPIIEKRAEPAPMDLETQFKTIVENSAISVRRPTAPAHSHHHRPREHRRHHQRAGIISDWRIDGMQRRRSYCQKTDPCWACTKLMKSLSDPSVSNPRQACRNRPADKVKKRTIGKKKKKITIDHHDDDDEDEVIVLD